MDLTEEEIRRAEAIISDAGDEEIDYSKMEKQDAVIVFAYVTGWPKEEAMFGVSLSRGETKGDIT